MSMKRVVLIAAVIALCVCSYALGDDERNGLLGLKRTLRRSLLYQDAATASALCAEEITYVNHHGRLTMTKTSFEIMLQKDFDSLVIVPLSIMWSKDVFSDDTTVFIWIERVLVYKEIADSRLLYGLVTAVFERFDETWLMTHFQYSLSHKPKSFSY